MEKVNKVTFIRHLASHQQDSTLIAAATSPVMEVIADTTKREYYLDSLGDKGYAIDSTGDLTSLFSCIKGQGKKLVTSAIKDGALHLDCFDGYLVDFYHGLGFVETSRVDNWTPGQPQIVFMHLEKK